MLSFTKVVPAEKDTQDQTPGNGTLPVQIAGTSTSENKTTESELSRGVIPPGGTISQVENSGVTNLGSTIVEGNTSEGKNPEGNLTENVNVGEKIPRDNMSEDRNAGDKISRDNMFVNRNAGGRNDPVGESDQGVIDVVTVASTSGLQDCGTRKNTDNLSEKAECSKNEQSTAMPKNEKETTGLNTINPAFIERQGTLFTEGIVGSGIAVL